MLFPDLGNPGIDVIDYDIDLTYDPVADEIDGSVTALIRPTESRSEFTLDSAGPVVSRVSVDGQVAAFVSEDRELRITPAEALQVGVTVAVRVDYSATPSAESSSGELSNGWYNTPGGSYVLNEPDGARTWVPTNDHPSDKATFTITVTVPAGVTAIANGRLVEHTSSAQGERWEWRQDDPMATYLIQVMTGDYELVSGVGPHGLPLLSAVLRSDRTLLQPFIDHLADQIAFFEQYFGPYPLSDYGIVIADSFGGLAMEHQGRSMFSRTDFIDGELGPLQELLLAHELAHQWFGDAVTLDRWSDIWLNESFATYGQWMWLEHIDMGTLQDEADGALARRQRRSGSPTGRPSADELFDFNSYDGGAVVLHALRMTVGDEAFFEILQRWVADNRGRSQSTAEFIALAEQVSGQSLTSLFDTWLYTNELPAVYPQQQVDAPLDSVAGDLAEDRASPLLGPTMLGLVAVGAHRHPNHRVDPDPAQRFRFPTA